MWYSAPALLLLPRTLAVDEPAERVADAVRDTLQPLHTAGTKEQQNHASPPGIYAAARRVVPQQRTGNRVCGVPWVPACGCVESSYGFTRGSREAAKGGWGARTMGRASIQYESSVS